MRKVARKKKPKKKPVPKSVVFPPSPPLSGLSGFGVDYPDVSDVDGRGKSKPESKIDGETREPRFGSPAYFGIDIPSPKLPDLDSILPRRISAVEWIGIAGIFVSLAAGFVLGAMAAAGIVDMGAARMMLLAALIVMTIGAFAVEMLSARSARRIAISTISTGLVTSVVLFGIISPWMVRKKKEQDTSKQSLDAQSKIATTQAQDDLRAELRADGNRAIRTLTMRIGLKRKYSIEEIGHFRIMYEVARMTNRITPDFYLAYQDYYAKNEVNASVDPNVKQFGYRTTVFYREQNNTYGAIPSYNISHRKYGAVTEASREVDHFESTWDLYNQISSYKILDDLNGKDLYIFVTESLADKISEVSFRVNNWELFSVKADRLIFPDDKPIAPWFMVLSKEEKAVSWKGVYVRNDEPLPPQVTSRFKGNPGWTWSLDFDLLHPKKIPEPELKIDPLKPS